ncbi:MAG: mechanosensitive ion channel family protein [Vicinamibacterales bacterium]
MWKRVFDGPVEGHLIVAALIPTLILAWLGASVARRLAAAVMRGVVRDTFAPTSPLVRGPLRLVFVAAFVLLVSVLLFPAFEIVGLQPLTGFQLRTLAAWLFGSGLRVVLIFLLAFALVRTTALLVSRFEHEISKGTTLDALERAKRARTLGSVVQKVASALIVGIALLMALDELGVDISPVLTGAGIVGLAVGFGAQTLVRDIISGFFLILEDQVRVGDVAAINGTGGLVEALNLRTIVLRDAEGTVHVFPNGAIQTLANRSKDFSFYVIDLDLSYREDPDRVAGILRSVGEEMRADPAYKPWILEPVEINGVDAFKDWSIVLKMRIKTMPLKQWDVGREFRKRIRKRFDQEGIRVPFPERIVTVRDSVDRDDAGPGGPPAAG